MRIGCPASCPNSKNKDKTGIKYGNINSARTASLAVKTSLPVNGRGR